MYTLAPGIQARATRVLICACLCTNLVVAVAKGERLLKDVYEALRNGPGWSKTLFFVTYDGQFCPWPPCFVALS
jgi:hypothetical protein